MAARLQTLMSERFEVGAGGLNANLRDVIAITQRHGGTECLAQQVCFRVTETQQRRAGAVKCI